MGEERGEDSLWRLANARGMSRRDFLRLMAFGGATAVLAACGLPDRTEPPTPTPPGIGSGGSGTVSSKVPADFFVHDEKNWEARLENLPGLITPNRYFFVRNNSSIPDWIPGPGSWRLSVSGDAIEKPMSLSYDDLRALPARVLTCYLECAGNHRAMFDIVQGRPASGTQWRTGAVSNGEWVGVSMSDVLTLAGVRDDAVSVVLAGLDTESPEGGFRRVIPAEKAMHPDTLLAYSLNGEPLPREHGHPVRALLPGWVGSSSIKWLGSIEVSAQQLWRRNNTTSYVLIGDGYVPEGEALGQVAYEQNVKSALALPWPTQLSAGRHRIHGYAHSPHGPIVRVEWSGKGETSWNSAELPGPQPQYSWARFEFSWEAQPGEHFIMTRATDAAGNTQPDRVPFNEKGYLFNQPVPHPIRVA